MRIVILVMLTLLLTGCCCPIPVVSRKELSRFTLGLYSDHTSPFLPGSVEVPGVRLNP